MTNSNTKAYSSTFQVTVYIAYNLILLLNTSEPSDHKPNMLTYSENSRNRVTICNKICEVLQAVKTKLKSIFNYRKQKFYLSAFHSIPYSLSVTNYKIKPIRLVSKL